MDRLPIAIDLFCGCGGISTGLLDAGVRVAAGFDFDRRSVEAYVYNHEYRGANGFAIDLANADGSRLLSLAGVNSVDLVVGGPPCQAFSIAGKQRGLDDERGALVFDFVRLVSELRPSAFILENVPNIAKIEDGRLLKRIMKRLRDAEFSVSHSLLFAPDYGVPQMRRRLIIVGVRGATPLRMPPPPTHNPGRSVSLFDAIPAYVSCRQALDDLPDADGTSDSIPNHEPTLHTSAMLEAFSQLAPGKRERKSFHDRLHPDRPAYTLRAGTGNFSPLRPIHYKYDRVITVRESARLQGFSDAFVWPDTIPRLQQYRQVGNAVPPQLAKAVATFIGATLRWSLDPTQLVGDANRRPSPNSKSPEQRAADVRRLIRGASLGASRIG